MENKQSPLNIEIMEAIGALSEAIEKIYTNNGEHAQFKLEWGFKKEGEYFNLIDAKLFVVKNLDMKNGNYEIGEVPHENID